MAADWKVSGCSISVLLYVDNDPIRLILTKNPKYTGAIGIDCVKCAHKRVGEVLFFNCIFNVLDGSFIFYCSIHYVCNIDARHYNWVVSWTDSVKPSLQLPFLYFGLVALERLFIITTAGVVLFLYFSDPSESSF